MQQDIPYMARNAVAAGRQHQTLHQLVGICLPPSSGRFLDVEGLASAVPQPKMLKFIILDGKEIALHGLQPSMEIELLRSMMSAGHVHPTATAKARLMRVMTPQVLRR